MSEVASAACLAVAAAAASTPAGSVPAVNSASMRWVIGTSASNSVLSPTSDWPRILMPSVAARSMATTSSPVSVSAVPAVMPAFMNAVPQMGPEVRASAKFGFDFLTCGDAARHAGDGGLLGGHGPGDDHEGSSGHMPITKDHARCHH